MARRAVADDEPARLRRNVPRMLQIASKMYFRPGVPLNSTVHRAVLYTNRSFLSGYPDHSSIALPVGQLDPSSDPSPISTVTVSITDHLEAVGPDGQDEILIATDGHDLIDDLAFVLSFALNATFSRDHDLVRRLVPDRLDEKRRSAPSNLFRATFDPRVPVTDEQLDDLRRFMTRLLALQRAQYEAALKAIRRVVRAGERAAQDPTTAYTDLVAALESLAKDEAVPPPTWDQLDHTKRTPIDAALREAPGDVSEAVRTAVMAGEHAGLGYRFTQFVMNRVSAGYFRHEAIGALRPIRRPDLLRAVKAAYRIRSRNVHTLWDLPAEAWLLNDRADTVRLEEVGTVLSLEGLARLARHVIRSYVADAPTGVDGTFDWRAALPGTMRVQMAPQHWIHNDAAFQSTSAARYFNGLVEHIIDMLAGRSDGLTDMSAVLEKIENTVPGLAPGDTKTIMVAIYALWHEFLLTDHHRPHAEAFLSRYGQLLQSPSLTTFVTAALRNSLATWTTEQCTALAEQRRATRQTSKNAQPVPAAFDAALQACAAARLLADYKPDEAAGFVSAALDELPGNQHLIDWEASLQAVAADPLLSSETFGPGGDTQLNLRTLILGAIEGQPRLTVADMAQNTGTDEVQPGGDSPMVDGTSGD